MYCLNYVCKTWSHGRHNIDSSIALSSLPLTHRTVCALILFKWQIALMGFQRLGAAIYTETTHECT